MTQTFEEAVDEIVEYFLEEWYEFSEREEVREDVEYIIEEAITKYGLDNLNFYIEMKELLSDRRY